jgi:DNA (cytosine-5)-methyltransferase 1
VKRSTKRPPAVRLLFEPELIIDGFAGGGGASTGLEMALGRSPDIAINHDREALAMHKVNHPRTRHIRSNIRKVRYGRLVRGRRVACGWFSPDCTYFSKARGRKPFRDRNKARRIRGLAWEMLRFALEVKKATGEYPRCLFMENVEEIQDWCPMGHDGQPDWSKRGKNFKAWVARWKNLGAAIEWKELRAMLVRRADVDASGCSSSSGSTGSRSSGRRRRTGRICSRIVPPPSASTSACRCRRSS